MSTITFEQAVERVKAEVDGRPDFVYTPIGDSEFGKTCVYFTDDGQPSCLVGAAFAPELTEADVILNHNEDGISTLIDNGILSATTKARDFLESVQANQDGGSPWGLALQYALESIDDDDYAGDDDLPA